MTGYLSVVIFLAFIVGFAVVSLAAARLLRPRRPFAAKLETYECGAEPIGEAWVQFPVGFYLVALVFILFDALAVFLFPWALVAAGLGVPGVSCAMVVFLAILALGWVYAYRGRGFSSGSESRRVPAVPAPVWRNFKDLQEWEALHQDASRTGDKHSAAFEALTEGIHAFPAGSS